MKVLHLPFYLQGIIMIVDERLHEKRGLSKWERLGHPLDSLSVLVPFYFINIVEYSSENFQIYALLGILSCLLITKDEWIHSAQCSPFELWLHALLFILHPLIFISGGIMWSEGNVSFLNVIPYFIGSLMVYQILRWSVLWQTPNK